MIKGSLSHRTSRTRTKWFNVLPMISPTALFITVKPIAKLNLKHCDKRKIKNWKFPVSTVHPREFVCIFFLLFQSSWLKYGERMKNQLIRVCVTLN